MSDVTRHYGSQGIVGRILAAVPGYSEDAFQLSAHHFFPFDQLHGRELQATREHAEKLAPRRDQRVLDIGSGIGGPARFIATTYGCRVTGVDLTPEFVAASNELSALCGLADRVHFEQADATHLPFEANAFDRAICFYVGMNLRDEADVVAEAFRVLKPGGRMLWTEATLTGKGEPVYPLPWAKDQGMSFLVAPAELRAMFQAAGFLIDEVIDESAAHVEFARQRAASRMVATDAQQEANELVLGQDLIERRKNYIRSLSEGSLASTLIVAHKA